jgi:hypothetical protein
MRADVHAGQGPMTELISRESPLLTDRPRPDGHALGTTKVCSGVKAAALA